MSQFDLKETLKPFMVQQRGKVRKISPKKKAGAFTRLATPAQKRAFWAKHPEARGVGYRRTGKTAQAWELIERGNGFILKNKSEGAFWVYDSKGQQPFLKESGWPTDNQIAEELAKEGQEFLTDALEKILT